MERSDLLIANLRDLPPIGSIDAGARVFSLVYVLYAYTGWNAACYLAGEVERAGVHGAGVGPDLPSEIAR